MKKQIRKTLLSTMSMLLVGVLCLTGVTFAWFSMGTEAQVNNFDVNVELADGAILVATPDASGNLVFGTTVTPYWLWLLR